MRKCFQELTWKWLNWNVGQPSTFLGPNDVPFSLIVLRFHCTCTTCLFMSMPSNAEVMKKRLGWRSRIGEGFRCPGEDASTTSSTRRDDHGMGWIRSTNQHQRFFLAEHSSLGTSDFCAHTRGEYLHPQHYPSLGTSLEESITSPTTHCTGVPHPATNPIQVESTPLQRELQLRRPYAHGTTLAQCYGYGH